MVKPALAEDYNTRCLSSQVVCKQRVPGTAHPKILQRQEETTIPRGWGQFSWQRSCGGRLSAEQGGMRGSATPGCTAHGVTEQRALPVVPGGFGFPPTPLSLLFSLSLPHILSISFHIFFFLSSYYFSFFFPLFAQQPFSSSFATFFLLWKKRCSISLCPNFLVGPISGLLFLRISHHVTHALGTDRERCKTSAGWVTLYNQASPYSSVFS